MHVKKSDLDRRQANLQFFLEELGQGLKECLEKRREYLGPGELSKDGEHGNESSRIFQSQR